MRVARCIGLLVLAALGARAAEHPHLLFSKADLPRLRAATETPEGKVWMENLRFRLEQGRVGGFSFRGETGEHSMQPLWAVGEGLLFQLSGDAEHARQAMLYVWDGMYEPLPNKNQWRQSHRIQGVALAYDLCYEAWPESFRRNVYHFLHQQALAHTSAEETPDRLNEDGRFKYASDGRLRIRGPGDVDARRYLLSAGLAALAIRHDTPKPYSPPVLADVPRIPPASGFVPTPGLPVVELTDGWMFDRWIANGPFPAEDADPLREIGGLAKARPLPGTRVSVLGEDLDFRVYRPAGVGNRERSPALYPRDCMRYFTKSTGNGFPPGLRVEAALREKQGRSPALAVTLYTVWRVKQEGLYQAFPNLYWASMGTRMWLNGREVADDEVVRLAPGLYPVMVHMPVTGGYANQAPHFRRYDEARATAEREGHAASKRWFAEHPDHLEDAHRFVVDDLRAFLRREIAPDGWMSWDLLDHLPPFAAAHRRATGENLVQGTGLEHIASVAAALHGLYESGASLRMAAQLAPFLNDREAALATWLRRKATPSFSRPSDVLWPLLSIDPKAPALSPAEALGRSLFTDASQIHVVRHEPAPVRPGLLFAMIGAGSAAANPAAGMSVVLAEDMPGAARPLVWFRTTGTQPMQALETASVPRIQNWVNLDPLDIVHREVRDDGTASLSLRTRKLTPCRSWTDAQGRDRFETTGGASAAHGITRAVWTDSSSWNDGSATVVLADTFHRVGRHQAKSIQFFMDQGLLNTKWVQNTGEWSVRNGTREIHMRLFAPRVVKGKRISHSMEGTRGIYRFTVDEPADDKERIRRTDQRMLLDGEISDMVLDFGDELEKINHQAAPEDLTIVTVIRIGPTNAQQPEIDWQAPILRLGNKTLTLKDGRWIP